MSMMLLGWLVVHLGHGIGIDGLIVREGVGG